MISSVTFRFTRDAVVELDEGDVRAIGAAVTVALCGHWEHQGPCRWPHLTATDAEGNRVAVSVSYDCTDDERARVEALIADALSSGVLANDGQVTRWRVISPGAHPAHGILRP